MSAATPFTQIYKRSTLALLAAGVVSLWACSAPDPVMPPLPSISAEGALAHGANLARGFGACGACHNVAGDPDGELAGGRLIGVGGGSGRAANITPAKSGIGEWSDGDIKRLFRSQLRPDGSEIGINAHRGFEWLSDPDVLALTAYLRSLPAIENEVERGGRGFVERNTTGFFETRREVRGYVPPISPRFTTEYGGYIVDSVARCGSCHNKPGGTISSEVYLAGGRAISFDGEERIAPNITPSTSSGIGSWSEEQIAYFLRSGTKPDGSAVDGRFCPTKFYSQAPDEQVLAVAKYLRSVPAED
jgi:cytochrome c553